MSGQGHPPEHRQPRRAEGRGGLLVPLVRGPEGALDGDTRNGIATNVSATITPAS